MNFFSKKEIPTAFTHKEKQKVKYYFFTLFINELQLTFLSKDKNQIEMKLTNLKDTYRKNLPMTFQVKECKGNYSFDIEPGDDVCEIIIPNLKEIKLIKRGETLI